MLRPSTGRTLALVRDRQVPTWSLRQANDGEASLSQRHVIRDRQERKAAGDILQSVLRQAGAPRPKRKQHFAHALIRDKVAIRLQGFLVRPA